MAREPCSSSSSSCRGCNVAVLGAAGGIGQPLSLLLKRCAGGCHRRWGGGRGGRCCSRMAGKGRVFL